MVQTMEIVGKIGKWFFLLLYECIIYVCVYDLRAGVCVCVLIFT